MPDQLSVHRNPGRNKDVIPFVVVVQSNRFRNSVRRVIVPLVAAEAFALADSDVGPHFMIGGKEVVLDPLQITNVPRDLRTRRSRRSPTKTTVSSMPWTHF
jgi:toxin CcdB